MRSADYFLGVPFNIASYGALLLILAAKTGSIARNLIVSFGDVHLYANHIEQAKLQYSRESSPHLPLLIYIGGDKPWEEIKAEDFLLEHYSPHPEIKAPIAV
jgi:thymidylate synthase